MRFWVGSKLLKMMHGASRACVDPWLSRRDGNAGISFVLLSVPFCVAIGASADCARAGNMPSKTQSDLDAALIAAVNTPPGWSYDGAVAATMKNGASCP